MTSVRCPRSIRARARALSATIVTVLIGIAAASAGFASTASAASYEPITGSGSTWVQNAIDQWRVDMAQAIGMTVNYAGVGSTAGRRDYVNDNVDFAVSELPFQTNPENGSPPEAPPRGFEYVPLTAGGLSFMYHLTIEGRQVTDLRLSGPTIARIFSGEITNWSDPAIQAENPAHLMPDMPLTPIVRADSSGTSAQFTQWMSTKHPDLWFHGTTSQFPVPPNGKAQRGSDGVASYVKQGYGVGAITYIESAYALEAALPVAKLLNAAGYYVAPTADAVSIALLGARVSGGLQVLDGVYDNRDPRAYPLSGYAYLIAPTEVGGVFTASKGATLGRFISSAVCEGQQRAAGLGYAPLPLNLVREAAARVADIPGSSGMDLAECANPTFAPGDTDTSNTLLRRAPMPPVSDHIGDGGGGNMSVTVTASGRFELTGPVSAIDFGAVRRGAESDVRQLAEFTIIDDRAELPGWTLEVHVDDFVAASGAGTISRSALGYAPHGAALPTGIAVGMSQAAGSSMYPAAVVTGDSGSATGEAGAQLGLGLRFLAPRNSPSGEFHSTLTLTLISG